MLAIHTAESKNCTPNLLPLRINHNGRINNTTRYWTPTTDEKGTQHAYFRGRHLQGTPLALPENYIGAVLNMTEKLAPREAAQAAVGTEGAGDGFDDARDEYDEDMEQDREVPEEVKIAEQIGEFDEVVVWGHGGVVDEGDAFVRGVKEWVGFAESMHCDDGEEDGGVDSNGPKTQ